MAKNIIELNDNTFSEIENSFKERLRNKIIERSDIADLVLEMNPEERANFKARAYDNFLKKQDYQVQVEAEREDFVDVPAWGATTPGAFMKQKVKIPARTRPLQDKITENIWSAYKDPENFKGDVNEIPSLLDLSEAQRKKLIQVGDAEKSSIVPYLKYDHKYLEAIADATEVLMKDYEEYSKDSFFRNSYAGEVSRGVVGSFVNPVYALSSIIREKYDSVPFGNPDNLTHSQIQDKAFELVRTKMIPYFAGTKDFDRSDVDTGKKIARGLGDVLSFLAPTPNKVGFTGGMQAAGKLGVGKGLPGAMAKMGAGSVALTPLHVLENAPEKGADYGVADYVGDVLTQAPTDAFAGSVLGALFHGGGVALRNLAGKYNPLYETIIKGTPEQFQQRFNSVIQNMKKGEATDADKHLYDFVKDLSKENNLNFSKIESGEISFSGKAQQLRPFVKNIPILKDVLPGERTIYNPRETTPIRESLGESKPFDASAWRAEADEALRRAHAVPYGGELPGKIADLRPAIAPHHNPSRIDLAKQKMGQELPSGRFPIYNSGPVADAEMNLFGEVDLPTSNDVFNRDFAPVMEVPVKDIKLSKDVPNFKENADVDTGVVDKLGGGYERLGTAPIVVWERLNGDLEVITGRHRLDLANRNKELTIPSQIVREADGFTVENAKTFDAESNIRDGNGSIRDYSHFFKNSPELTYEQALERGLLAREKGIEGWHLGKNAHEELYDLYRNNQIGKDKAVAIARNAPSNPDVQRAALKRAKTLNTSELSMFTRNLDLRYRYDGNINAGDGTGKQLDLFANDSAWMNEIEKISKTQAAMIRENLEKIQSVRSAIKRPEAAKKMGVDVNNPDAIQGEIDRLLIENRRIEQPDGDMLQKIRERAGLDTKPQESVKPLNSVNHKNQNLNYEKQYDITLDEINTLLKDFGPAVQIDVGVRFENIDDAVSATLANGNNAKNTNIGWDIKISRDEIKKFVFGKPKQAHGLLPKLKELISRAVYDREFSDRKERGNVKYHRFATLANDGTKDIPLILAVREIANGNKKYYDINLVKTETAQSARGGSDIKSSSNHEISQTKPITETSSKISKSQGNSDPLFSVKPQNGNQDIPLPEQNIPGQIFDTPLWETEKNPSLGARKIKPNTPLPKDIPSMGDIRRYLAEALDIPISEHLGRTRRGVLGYYRPKNETVRTKRNNLNNIQVITHEIGHDLHAKLFPRDGRKAGEQDRFVGEISDELAKNAVRIFGGNTYSRELLTGEGVAEYVHHWITKPTEAKKHWKLFDEVFNAQIQKFPDVHKILQNAKSLYEKYESASPIEKIKANIKSSSFEGAKSVREKLSDIFHKAYTNWVDELHPLERAKKEFIQLGANPVDVNFFDMATNYKGGALGKAQYAIEQRSLSLDGEEIGMGLRQILNGVGSENVPDFEAYLVARRALELKSKGKESGIDYKDAALVVSKYRSQFEEHAENLDRFQDQQFRLLVFSGMMSAESYAKIKITNNLYIPFHRLYEGLTTPQAQAKRGGGFINNSSPIKQLIGSDREIISPLESIIKNTFLFRDLAEKNLVAKNFAELLDNVQGAGKIAEPFFIKLTPTKLKQEEIERILRQSGLLDEVKVPDENGGMRDMNKNERRELLDEVLENPINDLIFRQVDATDAANGVFKIWKDGKVQYYQLHDRELYRALTLSDSKELDWLRKFPGWKLLTIPSRILRAGAILDPHFAVRNPLRDQVAAGIYSKNGTIPFVSALRHGFIETLFKGPMYKEWIRAGGRFSDISSVDRLQLDETLAKTIDSAGLLKQASYYLKNPLKGLRAFSEFTEALTRVTEYKLARKAGKSELEAANESKHISINFSRSGKDGKVLNEPVTFLNAGIQDVDRIARTFFNPKNPNLGKQWLKAFLYVILPSAFLWNYFKDDEEIQALPAWRKQNYWNFKVPESSTIFSIPKPFLDGVIFGSSIETVLDTVYQKNPDAVKDWFGALYDTANPFSIPTALKVPYDIMGNYNSFMDSPIDSMSDESIVPSQRVNSNTSTTAMMLADNLSKLGVEVSPQKIDYAIQGYTAGLGKLTVSGVDKILEQFSDLDLPPDPNGGWTRFPVIRAFNVNPYSSNRHVNEFYKEYENFKQRLGTANRLIKGKLDTAQPWVERNIDDVVIDGILSSTWKNMASDIKELNDTQALIRSAKNISGTEKHQMLLEITKEKNYTATEFMKIIHEARKEIKDIIPTSQNERE